MPSTRRMLSLCLIAGALAACGDDDVQGPPAVSFIEILPADTLVAPGDTVRMIARIVGVLGEDLAGVLTYTSSNPVVGGVDPTGLFSAEGTGTTTVTVRDEQGIQATAEVGVAKVTAMVPTAIAFGGVVRFHGVGLNASTTVRFGDVPALFKEADPGERWIDVWVPWTAESGEVTLQLFDGSVVTAPSPFFLIGGGDDVLEPNDIDRATEVEIPYRNPYLRAKLFDLDHVTFELDHETAIAIRVIDREPDNTWRRRLTLQLNMYEEPREFIGIASAFAFRRNVRQDAIISRQTLPPGKYRAIVFVAPGLNIPDRNYELRIDTVADLKTDPDRFEPNEFPQEAPWIEFPFQESLKMENPWAADYFQFSVDVKSRVLIEVETQTGDMGVFILDGDLSVVWHLSNFSRPTTFLGAFAPFGHFAFSCILEPGDYHVAVIENGGNWGNYQMTATSEPTTISFLNCAVRQPPLGEAELPEVPLLRALGAESVSGSR